MTIAFSHERKEARLEPFAYQLQAVEAAKDWEYAALFHEQGLGKTKIALDLALRWFGADAVDSAVIVTKKGLIANWQKEIARHTTLDVAVLSERRRNSVLFNRPYRLYLTHYEAVAGDQSRFGLFLQTRRVGVILDESQRIKNPESRLARCFLSLSESFARRVIMSGTPVANRPYDLWSQVKFLDGGKSLGEDFKAFRRKYDLPEGIEEAGEGGRRGKGDFSAYEGSLAEIFEKIRGFSIRETKKSAGISLPDKEIRIVWVEMEAEQARLYGKYRDELAAELLRDGRLILDDAEAVFKRLLRLVQVACDPALLDERYEGESGKRSALKSLVEEGLEGGSKVIVWTSFVANAEALARFLARRCVCTARWR